MDLTEALPHIAGLRCEDLYQDKKRLVSKLILPMGLTMGLWCYQQCYAFPKHSGFPSLWKAIRVKHEC